jgi:hypothetical protein
LRCAARKPHRFSATLRIKPAEINTATMLPLPLQLALSQHAPLPVNCRELHSPTIDFVVSSRRGRPRSNCLTDSVAALQSEERR